MSPLHPVEIFFILSAMGNLSLDTPTGCASPVPRHGYRPGRVVHPGRRHYGLMPRRYDTAWPVPMPRVQATGEDLDKISSKSHPMMMMVMCVGYVNGGQPLRVLCYLPSECPSA
jgi:hypothetical protein